MFVCFLTQIVREIESVRVEGVSEDNGIDVG